MSQPQKWTSIRVSPRTVERLKRVGSKGETYDDILNRLIDRLVEAPFPKFSITKEIKELPP